MGTLRDWTRERRSLKHTRIEVAGGQTTILDGLLMEWMYARNTPYYSAPPAYPVEPPMLQNNDIQNEHWTTQRRAICSITKITSRMGAVNIPGTFYRSWNYFPTETAMGLPMPFEHHSSHRANVTIESKYNRAKINAHHVAKRMKTKETTGITNVVAVA